MYPGHLEDSNRLIYVFINGALVVVAMKLIRSSSIILLMLACIGSLAICVVNMVVFIRALNGKQWIYVIMSTYFSLAAGIVAFAGIKRFILLYLNT